VSYLESEAYCAADIVLREAMGSEAVQEILDPGAAPACVAFARTCAPPHAVDVDSPATAESGKQALDVAEEAKASKTMTTSTAGGFLDETLDAAPRGWLDALRAVPKFYGLTDAERARIDVRNKKTVPPPPAGTGNSLGNHVAIGVVGTLSRILIRGLNRLQLYRMDVLYDAIEHRPSGLGLLTVSNHRSVADDPIMLSAMMPPRILYRPGLMRWGLCSTDICYQNPLFARFVMMGKALPITRSAGVGQAFVTSAAEKLVRGDWLHIYPEGRVVQDHVGYAKRGVGRMLAIAHERCGGTGGLPIVLPMYHEGMENVMPQDRDTHELLCLIPRVGHRIFAIAGDPLDVRDIFDRLMPACARAGGTALDPAECLKLYEEVADRLTLSIKILRAELRLRVRREHGLFLGDPYDIS
jgi:monolysocardiolipin acyltransferase